MSIADCLNLETQVANAALAPAPAPATAPATATATTVTIEAMLLAPLEY